MPLPTGTITLNPQCFKLDRANSGAMINGFSNTGIKQAIYCVTPHNWRVDHTFRLMTNTNGIRYSRLLSPWGNVFKYRPNVSILNHIAICDTRYQININLRVQGLTVLDTMCYGGLYQDLFGIWSEPAPRKRFVETNPSYFLALVRVCEIQTHFGYEHLDNPKSFPPHNILPEYDLDTQIVKPIIKNSDFCTLKERLEIAIAPFLINKPILVYNTR